MYRPNCIPSKFSAVCSEADIIMLHIVSPGACTQWSKNNVYAVTSFIFTLSARTINYDQIVPSPNAMQYNACMEAYGQPEPRIVIADFHNQLDQHQ